MPGQHTVLSPTDERSSLSTCGGNGYKNRPPQKSKQQDSKGMLWARCFSLLLWAAGLWGLGGVTSSSARRMRDWEHTAQLWGNKEFILVEVFEVTLVTMSSCLLPGASHQLEPARWGEASGLSPIPLPSDTCREDPRRPAPKTLSSSSRGDTEAQQGSSWPGPKANWMMTEPRRDSGLLVLLGWFSDRISNWFSKVTFPFLG